MAQVGPGTPGAIQGGCPRHLLGLLQVHLQAGLAGWCLSGMRTTSELALWFDILSATQDGIHFYMSRNNVICTKGNHKGTPSSKYLKSVQVLVSGETLPLPSAVLDAIVRSQGCRSTAPAVAHHSARSSVQYMASASLCNLVTCNPPCFHVTTGRTSIHCKPGWPGTWMKSTCPLNCLYRHCKPPNRLRRLKPQAPKRRRPRRRNHRSALTSLPHWDILVRHIRLCTSHLREVCHTTLQLVVGVSWTLLQPRYLCGTDFKACSSATSTRYSRPGPKSGVRSWLRNFILMTIIARPYGVRVPAQAAWAGGGSTVAPMCTQQELKHSGQQLLEVQIQP